MEHATPMLQHAPTQFIKSPLGIAALMLVSSFGGSWLKDRLSTETQNTSSAVRIEALDTRVNSLQAQLSDSEHTGVSNAQFMEFRAANDKRLDDIRSDLREVLSELSSDERQKVRAAERQSESPRAR